MAATARTIEITQEDLEAAGSGSSYDTLEVPNDYTADCVKIEDYDKRPNGSFGWIWHYKIEGLDFRIYTAFSKAARWKLIEVLKAHGYPVEEAGLNEIDPNAFVGTTIGAHVDFPKSYYEALEQGITPDRAYREIRWTFPLPGEAPSAPVTEEVEAL